jgi:ribonuclease PH
VAHARTGGRAANQHRPIEVEIGFHRLSEGSVLYRAEGTVVLATASIEEGVPKFMEGRGKGWITAEYQMHPRANPERREPRDGRNRPQSGRGKEIERLIGRSLRAAIIPEQLGERTLVVDCDVLEADGGTRTASVTAGWIALAVAIDKLAVLGKFHGPPLRTQIAAISVGHVADEVLLDLNYSEDSKARVDLNAVGTDSGAIVELQGTAEGEAVPREDMDSMIDLALEGISSLCQIQRDALQQAGVKLDRVVKR